MNVIYLYLSKKKTLTEPFCRRDVNFNFNLRRIITFRNLVQSYFVSSFKPVLHFNTFSKNVRRSSRIGIFCRPPSAFPSPRPLFSSGECTIESNIRWWRLDIAIFSRFRTVVLSLLYFNWENIPNNWGVFYHIFQNLEIDHKYSPVRHIVNFLLGVWKYG